LHITHVLHEVPVLIIIFLSDCRSCGEEEEEGEEEGGDEEGGASIHVSFKLHLAQLSHSSDYEKFQM
jgi:hypothetical protein